MFGRVTVASEGDRNRSRCRALTMLGGSFLGPSGLQPPEWNPCTITNLQGTNTTPTFDHPGQDCYSHSTIRLMHLRSLLRHAMPRSCHEPVACLVAALALSISISHGVGESCHWLSSHQPCSSRHFQPLSTSVHFLCLSWASSFIRLCFIFRCWASAGGSRVSLLSFWYYLPIVLKLLAFVSGSWIFPT
ncbi:uncharacterized protein BCR38DRAFT_229096 [Pseudomassariella vexata]|uniref:Uncharacterized protein n=1 Tax=Pseudomassariella vexata TaxID=1141098 RepID=A0A1Y2DWA7_9PEZI|nr:uncharacterized protein BCR38DRAFT_229096 [Pseudomassariella vexata]ORY63479.1 hypothetical protein BCR38DRAFT_229096 [Pseudomassariella vexata]